MAQPMALVADANTQLVPACPARAMQAEERQGLALRALAGTFTITQLADDAGVSRKFVYQQVSLAQQALDEAFTPETPDQRVLFELPVTKAWLRQVVLSLVLTCHAPYRGILAFCGACLNQSLSLGTIPNIVDDAVAQARLYNERQSLAGVGVGLLDEIFQSGQPVLVGIDAPSTYCFLLSAEDNREGVTWGVRLLEAQDRGLAPASFVADFGSGLRNGLALALPDTPCWGDVFHGLYTVQPVVTALEKAAYEALNRCDRLERQAAEYQRRHGRANLSFAQKLRNVRPVADQALALADDVALLARWLRDDVLALAGPCLAERQTVYDFLVAERRARAPQCPHRLNPLCTFLENQRDPLLAFAGQLDRDLAALAAGFQVGVDTVRDVLYLQSLSDASPRRGPREADLRRRLRDRFHALSQAVQTVAERIVRASSAVENLNSRLRTYFTLRRELGPDYLTLLQFYLNHRRFPRSERPERVGKSPAELLTGQKHPHWLELLGYAPFSRN
jgi:hypothetical protein